MTHSCSCPCQSWPGRLVRSCLPSWVARMARTASDVAQARHDIEELHFMIHSELRRVDRQLEHLQHLERHYARHRPIKRRSKTPRSTMMPNARSLDVRRRFPNRVSFT